MSDNGKPVFQQVYYINPFATIPPGWSQTGVVVDVDQPGDPTNLVLAGRLRLETAEVMVTLGATPTQVRLLPQAPLSATASYAVDVQWVTTGTDPANINWSNTAITSTSPVVTAYLQLFSGQLVSGQLRVAFEPGAGGIVPTGANLTIFDDLGRSAGFTRVEGSAGDVSFTPGNKPPYRLYLQGVLPTAGSGTGTFAEPYSLGPLSSGIHLPTAAPKITALAYDGATLRASWQALTLAANAGPISFHLLAQGSDGSVIEVPAGPTGGSVTLGASGADSWSVSGRMVQGRIVGLAGTAVDALTATPAVSAVEIAGQQVAANVALPAEAPAGSVARGYLRAGETIVAGPVDAAGGVLTFDFEAAGTQGLSVVAQAYTTGSPSLAGPLGSAVPVLSRAPTLRSVSIATDPSDSTKWSIAASWDPAQDPQVTGYELALNGGTPVVTDGTSATLSVAKSAITDPANSVTVTAMGIGGSRSPAAEQAVLFRGPLLASTAVTGATVTGTTMTGDALQASWAAPTAPGGVTELGYVVVVHDSTSDAEVYRSAPVSALSASLPLEELALQKEGDYTVGLLVVSGILVFDAGSDGTAKTRAPILLATVEGFYSITNALSGVVTLLWTALSGASEYRVQLGEAAPVTVTGASYSLPSAPTPNQSLAVRIAADSSQDGVTAAGPFAGPWPVLTAQTSLVAVGYDGTEAEVSWVPVAGATGYAVSVLKDGSSVVGSPATAGATAASVRFTPGLTDTTKTYTVVVQVTAGPSSGASTGPPSPAMDLFAPAFFLSRVAASTAYPYLFPARTLAQATATTLGTSGSDVVLYLGDLGGGTTLHGLPISSTPATGSTSAFTLATSSGSTRPYRLTIVGAGAAWAFGANPMRTDLAGEYVGFLRAVENAGAVPWGISQLQLTIARAMPQTFQEVLYYSYGLTFPGSGATYGSVDLRPGMVLRVASSDYMSVGGTSSSTWLAGYTGTTVNDYEVASYQRAGGWLVGMDAFIAQLAANGALTVGAPPSDPSAAQEGGLAESADLFYPSFQQPFYRLFIPSSLLSASGSGSTSTASNFTLAAADNYAALTTSVNVPSATNTVAYFRGRSVLKILIRVRLDGSELLLPVGTTVGNLLDRLASQPASAAAALVGLELKRSLGPVAFSESAALDAGQSWPVQLAWDGLQVYGPTWNALSMPLLHGDSLTTGSQSAVR